MNRQDTLTLLKQVKPFDATEESFVNETIAMVERTIEFWSERSLEGHVTTSWHSKLLQLSTCYSQIMIPHKGWSLNRSRARSLGV